MRVIISVGGRFHAFNLAHELFERGHLERLITSYPKFAAEKFGIPKEKTRSVIIKEIMDRGWRKLPNLIRNAYNPQFLISEIYDKWASRHITPCDVFVGFSSFALHSFPRAKRQGAITLVERGNAHIAAQNNLLQEEYQKFGLKPVLPHPKIIEKELKEYELADYISFPENSYVYKSFLDNGIKPEKLIQIQFGVNLSSFYPGEKKDNVFRVIFVGGMTIRKGLHYLLQAFAELNLPNSELLLVGAINDEIKPFFRKYSGHFRYIGHVPQACLREHYSQSSVFVIPSLDEGAAMVQYQAMACAIPVIGTPHTGSENLIEDGVQGFIIPIRNTEALKGKLTYLYENPEIRNRMGKAAYERIKTGFTWNDYGARIVSAYSKLLA